MLRKNIMGALALVACLAWASDAYGFGHSHGSHGSSGGYSSGGYSSGGYSSGSSGGYSSGGYSSGSSGGYSSGGYSSGSSGGYSSGHSSGGGGLLRAIFGHRRHYYTSYGSSGGYSSGGYSSWGSHGGSSGSSGGYYYSPATPAQPAAPPDLPAGEAPAATAYLQSNNAALITVTVPENAEVLINDVATTSTGTLRRYISRGLEPGRSYSYRVTAKVYRNGKQFEDTKLVSVVTGDATALAFDPNLGNTEEVVPVSTTLIVKMPADAKLFLAGKDTNTNGERREFSTTHLSSGNEWESYVVRGEWVRDGQTLVATQYVDLKAGDQKEVELDFETAEVSINR